MHILISVTTQGVVGDNQCLKKDKCHWDVQFGSADVILDIGDFNRKWNKHKGVNINSDISAVRDNNIIT